MRSDAIRAGSLAMALVLAGTLVSPLAHAQNQRLRAALEQRRTLAAAQRQAQKGAPNANLPKGGASGNGAKPAPNLRGMEGLPPKWVENLRDMPPEEQDKFMQNDARFRNLPAERQAQIRQNLQKWDALTPQQQQQAKNAATALANMSPGQRQYVRNTLLPRWQAMPFARRQVINRHLAMLSQMSPETQQAALNDPKFTQGMSLDEQEMLRNLNSLRNTPNE